MSDLIEISDYRGPGRLLRLSGDDTAGAPVLMTHGTYSNADTMQPLAQFLHALGRKVFIIEWRDRGGRPGEFDFHDLAEDEISKAVLHLNEPVHLLAHSGGGMSLCFAQENPGIRALTKSLTLIATQGTHLSDAPGMAYPLIRAMGRVSRLLGYWPKRFPGLGPCDESARLVCQWIEFNKARKISTRSGADLFDQLQSLMLPVLALAGAADVAVARPEGCKALADAFGTTSQFHVCAKDSDGEDFTHSRLIRSRAAARSVWPRIATFIETVDLGANAKANAS